MSKYKNATKNQKMNKKKNAFQMFHIYKRKYNKLSNELKNIDEQMSDPKFNGNYVDLIEKKMNVESKINQVSNKFEDSKSKLIKLGCKILTGTVLISGMIGMANYKNNKDLTQNIDKANEYIYQDESNYNKTEVEDIKDSPTMITQLALDTLKAKIAKTLNIKNSSDIKISVDDSMVASTNFTDISIAVNGIVIGNYKSSFSNSCGESYINSDNSISKEVVDVISSIAKAQKDVENKTKANKALEESVDLLSNQISLPKAIEKLAESNQNNVKDNNEDIEIG